MTDWAASGRRDAFTAHLVDPFTLQETGEQVGIEEGKSTIEWDASSATIASASIALVNATNRDRLLRIKQAIDVDGEQRSLTLGTFFCDSSSAAALHGGVRRSCDCYSTLYRLTDDVLVRDFARPRGYNVVEEIRELVEADGGLLRVGRGVDATRLHTVDVWFEVGENRAEVLRTIAGWIGCEVGVDADGYVTLEPRRQPSELGVSYTFEEGANCVYRPGVDVTDTKADAVNRVLAHWSRAQVPTHARRNADGSYAKGEDGSAIYDPDDGYGLAGSAWVDLPATHPFSYERIGRRRSHVMRLTDPCSDEELRARASEYLWANCGSTEFYEVEHVQVPTLKVGDKVRYVNDMDCSVPVDFEAVVEQISLTLAPGAPCKTKLRRL